MNPALRMGVDGNVVAIFPQRPKKSQCFQFSGLDEIFLVNAVQVRIIFKQILRTGPKRERVNRCAGKIRAQFANQRRGQERVANARQGNDQDFHNREIFSSNDVVDFPGTNGTITIFPPADSTARRSSWFNVSMV